MRNLVVTLLLGFIAAASWWAWMAWDHTYQRDPATGEWHGPYQEWQVLGCVLTLVGVAYLGATRAHPATIALMPVTFTLAWSATAAPGDDTGMWLFGAVLVLGGTTIGAAVIGVVAATVRSARERRDRAQR